MNIYKSLFEKERKHWLTEKEKLNNNTNHMQSVCFSQESEIKDLRQEITRLNDDIEEKN